MEPGYPEDLANGLKRALRDSGRVCHAAQSTARRFDAASLAPRFADEVDALLH